MGQLSFHRLFSVHIKGTSVCTDGNEEADQAAKEGAAGGSHMKVKKPLIPWQVAKNRIEEYTTNTWKQIWTATPHYKHTYKAIL